MNNFRLFDIEIDDKAIRTERITLVDKEVSSSANYISLIVGNNGTGKSRILSNIARFFVDRLKERQKPLFGSEFRYNRMPSKIIAVTNSISDKFPVDESFRPSRKFNENLFHREFGYNYLGTRNRVNSFSSKALMNRALEIIFENYSELDVSRNYRHVFDYLEYEPILKIDFKINSNLFKYAGGNIIPDDFFHYLENNRASNRFNQFSSERFRDIIGNNIDELCNFINSNRYGEQEILINFSAKNISRISRDESKYLDNVTAYNLLGILRKLNIVRSIGIKVYKKGGSEFNFSDASSGEANILSTLIALIPLIQDNSLVLIDEPEISLHPLWQAKYIELINNIFSGFSGCHIIIASHSPFLVTDLPPSKSSVITLRNKKGFIISETLRETTFGLSAENILLNVFNMPSTRNFYLSQIVSESLELLADNNRSISRLNELRTKLASYLPNMKDNDPLTKVVKLIMEEGFNE